MYLSRNTFGQSSSGLIFEKAGMMVSVRYKGRLTLLFIILIASAEFTTYDYINDLPAVKRDILGSLIL